MAITRSRLGPIIAIAVAAFGLLCLFLVDHGPWTERKAQNGTMIESGTTAAAAAAVGAAVIDMRLPPAPEPVSRGTKPARPAMPESSKGG